MVGKRPEDACLRSAEGFGNTNLAKPPGPIGEEWYLPQLLRSSETGVCRGVVGEEGGEVGGGNILATREEIRKLKT